MDHAMIASPRRDRGCTSDRLFPRACWTVGMLAPTSPRSRNRRAADAVYLSNPPTAASQQPSRLVSEPYGWKTSLSDGIMAVTSPNPTSMGAEWLTALSVEHKLSVFPSRTALSVESCVDRCSLCRTRLYNPPCRTPPSASIASATTSPQ